MKTAGQCTETSLLNYFHVPLHPLLADSPTSPAVCCQGRGPAHRGLLLRDPVLTRDSPPVLCNFSLPTGQGNPKVQRVSELPFVSTGLMTWGKSSSRGSLSVHAPCTGWSVSQLGTEGRQVGGKKQVSQNCSQKYHVRLLNTLGSSAFENPPTLKSLGVQITIPAD